MLLLDEKYYYTVAKECRYVIYHGVDQRNARTEVRKLENFAGWMRGSHANGEIYGKYSRARTCPQIELLALAIYLAWGSKCTVKRIRRERLGDTSGFSTQTKRFCRQLEPGNLDKEAIKRNIYYESVVCNFVFGIDM